MPEIIIFKDETGRMAGFGERGRRAWLKFRKIITELEIGETMQFSWRMPRSPQHHRFFFAKMTSLFERQERFDDFERLLDASHKDSIHGLRLNRFTENHRKTEMNNIITTPAIKTMTTREVADLIEKQHSHIKISAERLAEKGVIGTLATREFTHNGNVYTEYLLCKRDSLILVAQNCPEYTARIVDRWQELEEQVAKPIDPMQFLSDPAAMRGLLLNYTERVIALESKVSEQTSLLEVVTPKAQALDRISTFSDGAMCITNAAKALQLQPKKLFDWLKEKQWIYRRAGGAGWVGYQSRIQVGLLEHKVTTVERTDGSTKQAEQVLVTAKGLAKLATDLGAGQLVVA